MHEALTFGDLRIQTGDNPLQFVFLGKSSAREPLDDLRPHFEAWIADAGARGAPLELRFERLDHMNSGTITALIFLIDRCEAQRVLLKLVYAKAKKWQRLSFEALRVFQKEGAPLEVVAIE